MCEYEEEDLPSAADIALEDQIRAAIREVSSVLANSASAGTAEFIEDQMPLSLKKWLDSAVNEFQREVFSHAENDTLISCAHVAEGPTPMFSALRYPRVFMCPSCAELISNLVERSSKCDCCGYTRTSHYTEVNTIIVQVFSAMVAVRLCIHCLKAGPLT